MKNYDVFGVGNALVDILVTVDDVFLKDNKLEKGVMTLVDAETQGQLLSALGDHKRDLRSGGSAANTMIAIANSGGTGCYTGKVTEDTYGEFYKTDMEEAGIVFEVAPTKEGHTGTCVVLITPDAERTMLTHLGISTSLTPTDIDIDRLKKSKISYVEGYLWDGVGTKNASILTMEESKKAGVQVSFTYSDPFCVNRSRDEFIKLSKEYVDIAFCNFEEAKALSEMDRQEDAIRFIGELCQTAFMTDSANGAYICHEGKISQVPGFPVKPVDTTGAGDAFAAGVLFGLTHNYSLEKACRWGNYVASRMILETGARLAIKLMGRQDEILK